MGTYTSKTSDTSTSSLRDCCIAGSPRTYGKNTSIISPISPREYHHLLILECRNDDESPRNTMGIQEDASASFTEYEKIRPTTTPCVRINHEPNDIVGSPTTSTISSGGTIHLFIPECWDNDKPPQTTVTVWEDHTVPPT
jgi:hypothetical protein